MKIALSCLNVKLNSLGGVQNRLRYLVRGILEEGHDLHIIQTKAAHKESDKFYASLGRVPKTIVLPNPGNTKYPWAYLRQNAHAPERVLAKEKFDLLDTYDPYTKLKRVGIPVVYTTNFFMEYVKELLGIHQYRYAYGHFLKCIVEGKAIDRADHFIIQNTIQKRRLTGKHGVPEDSISIIPTGYDENIINEIAGSSGPGAAGGDLVVYSGRISVYKGVFELVDAFEGVNKTHPSWKLWLVGDGPDRGRLEHLVKERGLSGTVAFKGPQTPEDTIRHTAKADIFVFPSYIESVPGALLEAMALGKPCVAADVGAIGTDIIDEDSGILVPPRDAGRLREGIIRLIENPQMGRKMGQNARAKVSGLTKQNMVKRTLAAYETVVERCG